MNKLKYIFFSVIGILAFVSCSSDDDSVDTTAQYYNWQAKNDAYFSAIYQTATDSIKAGKHTWYKILAYNKTDSTNVNNFIVIHVLAQDSMKRDTVNGMPLKYHREVIPTKEELFSKNPKYKSPLYNDTATVTYRGNMIPFDNSYASTYNVKNGPDNWLVGITFDTKFYGNLNTIEQLKSEAYFVTFAPSGVVSGFATALQYMHPGDRWRVFIPYNLGYGSSSSGSVQAYSTLIFDLYLKSFTTRQ